MRLVVQRVSRASVTVDGEVISSIGAGLLVLVGVQEGDKLPDAEFCAGKIANLRIFEDGEGKMNRSLLDTGGEALLVSQFTLLGDARKGRRPSFIEAADPETADRLYLCVAEMLAREGIPVKTGKFRAHMEVMLINDGPVTILLDSRR